MDNIQTNQFRPDEQEVLDNLSSSPKLLLQQPSSRESLCDFQNDVRWDINFVLCYRYVHYQEPPFEPLINGFTNHLKFCRHCRGFLSIVPQDTQTVQQEKQNILQVLRHPEGLIRMHKKMGNEQTAQSTNKIYKTRLLITVHRLLDAISAQNRLEFLLAIMRLKIAQVLEKIYFNQDQDKTDHVYPPCSRLRYPHEIADIIDLVYATLRNGTMEAPEHLLDYFEHAIKCETCQVGLAIPDDQQDKIVITTWASKIKADQLALVIAEKELLKECARSPAESEHIEEIFREALKRANAEMMS